MMYAPVASEKTLIRWKLRELMARKKKKTKELADRLKMQPGSVSRLKAQDKMPKLDGDQIEIILKFLDCDLFELIEQVPDKAEE